MRPRALKRVTVAVLVSGYALVAACWSDAQTAAPLANDPPHLLEGDSAPDASSDNPARHAWQVQRIEMPERPVKIIGNVEANPLASVRVIGVSGDWFALSDCAKGLCAIRLTARHTSDWLPPDALPGSHLATSSGRIAKAWFADPVQRIENSAIGRFVAGSLVVRDTLGREFRLDLALDQAFEDVRPRIANLDGPLDGPGTQTLFAVRSSTSLGAALVAVRLEGEGLLHIVGETPAIGRPGGWLNPVGISDFLGEGRKSIAYVTSPDKLGVLQIAGFADGAFKLRLSVPGVSNHTTGTAITDMAVIGDFEATGGADIAIPDASRKSIRILSFLHGQIAEPADIALPAEVTTEVVGIRPKSGERPMLLMGLADGELVLLH